MSSADALERVFRAEAGRLVASLVRLLGDFDLAEEMVSEAVVEALAHWPSRGVPERPGAWLLTTARRKAIDRLRREGVGRRKLELLAALPDSAEREPDDRLRLIYTCCHPALGVDAQVALTLRAVAGLTTTEIARAFLVAEPTLAKRLVRAKRKIVDARIPYREPEPEELPARLAAVLRVIYLIFNEGWLATSGPAAVRGELVEDAHRLATMLVALLDGEEPEALALLALIRLHLARWRSRLDASGRLVLLTDQDRSLWNRRLIADGVALIERAARAGGGRPGPLLIEASIAALHCEAPSWEQTDWRQIVALYSLLAAIEPSPLVSLNRAIAHAPLCGWAAALDEVDALAGELDGYHLFHATRAWLLRSLGRDAEARAADAAALERTRNRAERALLGERLGLQAAATSGRPIA